MRALISGLLPSKLYFRILGTAIIYDSRVIHATMPAPSAVDVSDLLVASLHHELPFDQAGGFHGFQGGSCRDQEDT